MFICMYIYTRIYKTPPKWQKNDLVPGGHGQAGSLRGQWTGWIGSAPVQIRDVVWTARCRDGAMSCCWLWLFCAYPSFLVGAWSGCQCWPRLQRAGRMSELLGVKLGFLRSRCRTIVSDVLCVRSYVHFDAMNNIIVPLYHMQCHLAEVRIVHEGQFVSRIF